MPPPIGSVTLSWGWTAIRTSPRWTATGPVGLFAHVDVALERRTAWRLRPGPAGERDPVLLADATLDWASEAIPSITTSAARTSAGSPARWCQSTLPGGLSQP